MTNKEITQKLVWLMVHIQLMIEKLDEVSHIKTIFKQDVKSALNNASDKLVSISNKFFKESTEEEYQQFLTLQKIYEEMFDAISTLKVNDLLNVGETLLENIDEVTKNY